MDWTPTGDERIGPLTVCALMRGTRRAALKHRLKQLEGTAWGHIAEAVANVSNGNGATRLRNAMDSIRLAGMDAETTRKHLMGEIVRWDAFVDGWLLDDAEFIRRRGLPDKTVEEVSGMFDDTTWLWEDWLPRGNLSMICGRPGVGKSWVAAWIGANLIANGSLPDGSHAEQAQDSCVVWIDTEGTHNLLVRRLKLLAVAGGRFKWPLDPNNASDPFPVVDFAKPHWMTTVMDYAIDKMPIWIVVDSLRGAHGADENSSEVQAMLSNCAAIARDVGCGFTFLHHLRKSNQWETGEITLDMVRGSSAIAAMMRVVIAIDQPDVTNKALRMRVIKSNLSLMPEPVGIELRADGPVRLDWSPSVPRPMSAADRACEFLVARLQQGPRPAIEMLEEAKQLGISQASLIRARAKLMIVVARIEDHWEWSLPVKEGQIPL